MLRQDGQSFVSNAQLLSSCISISDEVVEQKRNKKTKNLMNFLTDFLGLYPNIYCSDSPIGLETGTVPDRNITASSYLDSNPPLAARLGSHVGWCPLNLSKVFLQVDLGSAYYICAVATQGHFEQGFGRLARYAILLSLNGKNWTEYEQVMTSNS